MGSKILESSGKKILKINGVDKGFGYDILEGVDFDFCFIIENSQVSFDFNFLGENSKSNCIFLIPSHIGESVKLDVNVSLNISDAFMNVKIYCLANDGANISINGNLKVNDNVSGVEARLYEEALLMGKANYISLVPSLTVSSPDVLASHGAKIHRISEDKLFYMQSRGLSVDKSVKMIINSYCQNIVDELHFNENEKSEFYSLLNLE